MKLKTIDKINKETLIIAPNFKLISTSHDYSGQILHWKCPNSHDVYKPWSKFKGRPNCKYCFHEQNTLNKLYSIDQIIQMAHEIDSTFELLSSIYVRCDEDLLWKGPCGHEFHKSWSNFKQKPKCPVCSLSTVWQNNVLTFKSILETAQQIAPQFKLISTSYSGCFDPLTWMCPNNHEFIANWSTFKGGTRCNSCNDWKRESKGEKQCRKIFETIFKVGFKTIRPNFLKNPETGYNLELDGYNEELKLAFEFDGIQHHIRHKSGYMAKEFNIRQKRDRLKDKLCKENNITLIRIPYWEKDNLEEFIKSELRQRRGLK